MNCVSPRRAAVNAITASDFIDRNPRRGDYIIVRVPILRFDDVTTTIMCMVESINPFKVRPIEISRTKTIYTGEGPVYANHSRKLK
jgi:hypothetical protein